MTKAFVIKQGNKTVGFRNDDKSYVIGFKNVNMARQIQYGMHPSPEFKLERGRPVDIPKDKQIRGMILDAQAKLYISKCPGNTFDAEFDGGFHLHTDDFKQILIYPCKHHVGLVMPYEILEETQNEYILKSQIIEPNFEWLAMSASTLV